MGMISALTPAMKKEAAALAKQLGISLEEAATKLFSKSTPTVEKQFATEFTGSSLSDKVRAKPDYEGSLPTYEEDPSAPKMSLSKKLALGAAAAGTAATAGQLLYNPANPESQKSGPTRDPEPTQQGESAPAPTPPPAIVPPPTKSDEPVMESQARRNYNQLSKELFGHKAEQLPEGFTQEARAELKKAYEDKVSRNDWAELATTLANALAQYGSAHQAGDKYNGAIKIAPGIDYAGRSDRAFKEYTYGLSEQDKIVAAKQRAIDAKFADTDREMSLRERVGRGAADLESDANKLALDKAARVRAEQAATQAATGGMTDREKLEEKRKDIAAENLSKQTIAGNALIETLDEIDNTTDDKTKRSLILKATALQGAAGVTKEDMDEATKAGTTPGLIYGTNLDKEKKLSKLAEILASKRGGSSTSTGKTDQQPVTVRHKSTGQTRQFPAGSVELQNALQSPEFEIVR